MGSLAYLCLPLAGILVFTASAAQVPLYEEDLLASSPIRVEQWKQMQAYAESLPTKSLPAHPGNFREAIGYPPPGFLATPTGHFDKVAEDNVATYYRTFIRVTPQMETYGLYIVPRNVRLPAPLVISQHGGGGTPEMATFHGGTNYHDLVRGAVAEGYVVFAPLTIMYPYRDRDHDTPIPADVRGVLDDQLRARGTTLMGME